MVSTFLTGEPFLGRYPVNQQPFRVLFINPEEASYTPYRRLMSMGISREAYNDQYLDLHSQHARFYFNARPHVEKMLEALNGHGWLDDDTPKILIVDGLQPTLAGEAWNADLEAWKEGIGRLQLELKTLGHLCAGTDYGVDGESLEGW